MPPAVSRATSTRPGRGSRATANGVSIDATPPTRKKATYAHRPIARVPASRTKPAGRRRAVERAMVSAPIRGPTSRRSASGSTTAVHRVMFEPDRTPAVWPIATVTEMSAIPVSRAHGAGGHPGHDRGEDEAADLGEGQAQREPAQVALEPAQDLRRECLQCRASDRGGADHDHQRRGRAQPQQERDEERVRGIRRREGLADGDCLEGPVVRRGERAPTCGPGQMHRRQGYADPQVRHGRPTPWLDRGAKGRMYKPRLEEGVVRKYPTGDERREVELAAVVREVAGDGHRFLV